MKNSEVIPARLSEANPTVDGSISPSIEPMTDSDRTLLETLLEAAFGTQCVRDYEARMLRAKQEYDALPSSVKTAESQSLLALNGVISKGYALMSEPGWIDEGEPSQKPCPLPTK